MDWTNWLICFTSVAGTAAAIYFFAKNRELTMRGVNNFYMHRYHLLCNDCKKHFYPINKKYVEDGTYLQLMKTKYLDSDQVYGPSKYKHPEDPENEINPDFLGPDAKYNWWNHPEEGLEHTENPIESFTIFFENFDNKIFDNLSFNILFNFFLIIFMFYIIISAAKPMYIWSHIANVFDSALQIFFSLFKNFLKNLRFERFFFFLIIIFLFILFTNFGGFSLYELSFTSHAVISLFLSFILFFNYFINILINFNENFFKKFIQKNLGIFLKVVLFAIEFVSFFIRPFSLGIRLFANILSGHILIHIFFNAFIAFYKIVFWLSFLLLAFCFFILFLEIFVACVQSYIFLILSFIYLQDVAKIHV